METFNEVRSFLGAADGNDSMATSRQHPEKLTLKRSFRLNQKHGHRTNCNRVRGRHLRDYRRCILHRQFHQKASLAGRHGDHAYLAAVTLHNAPADVQP